MKLKKENIQLLKETHVLLKESLELSGEGLKNKLQSNVEIARDNLYKVIETDLYEVLIKSLDSQPLTEMFGTLDYLSWTEERLEKFEEYPIKKNVSFYREGIKNGLEILFDRFMEELEKDC